MVSSNRIFTLLILLLTRYLKSGNVSDFKFGMQIRRKANWTHKTFGADPSDCSSVSSHPSSIDAKQFFLNMISSELYNRKVWNFVWRLLVGRFVYTIWFLLSRWVVRSRYLKFGYRIPVYWNQQTKDLVWISKSVRLFIRKPVRLRLVSSSVCSTTLYSYTDNYEKRHKHTHSWIHLKLKLKNFIWMNLTHWIRKVVWLSHQFFLLLPRISSINENKKRTSTVFSNLVRLFVRWMFGSSAIQRLL